MLAKDTIRDLMLKECDICLHLYEKVPAGTMDYRPTPGQRSTAELLKYLSYCAIGGSRTFQAGDWDPYHQVAQRAESETPEDFPAAMARQKEELTAFFDGLTQDELENTEAQSPLGETMPLEEALVSMPLHWMVAYRMQLFLYAKQAGNDEIWTPNLWGGIDRERPAPAQ